MKKHKMMVMMTLGLYILLLAGCGQKKLGEEFTEEVNTLEGVTLTIEEGKASASGVTYTINNQSGQDINFGQDYSLQMEKDGKWYYVEPKEAIAVTMELLWLPAGTSESYDIIWNSSYGKLSSGHYRIVKNISDNAAGYYLSGEFQL